MTKLIVDVDDNILSNFRAKVNREYGTTYDVIGDLVKSILDNALKEWTDASSTHKELKRQAKEFFGEDGGE